MGALLKGRKEGEEFVHMFENDMVGVGCQLHRVQNQLGNRPLGVHVWIFLSV